METTLLKDIPRKCQTCDVYIFTEAPIPKIGRKAWTIAAAGVLATAIWVVLFFTFSDFYISPRGARGVILCALIYGWPFFVSALIAWKLPLEVSSKCFKCGEKKLYTIGIPKM